MNEMDMRRKSSLSLKEGAKRMKYNYDHNNKEGKGNSKHTCTCT